MSIALYRRYRPETFQEVIGQDHVVQPLMAALDAGRTTHAYLFSGPRGCGKTTSARILARALNCVEYPTATPCGTCPSCVELARDGSGSLDVVEMDAASHGGVDDARELREQAGFAPVRDRFKIFIIDEAHMVTNQGFNALLKLVEEPPAHVKFIFATTEPEKVIGTIRSRTHHYPFRLVPPQVLEEYLAKLTEAEGVKAGHDLLSLVVRAGTGSVRDTLSVLDQIIGGSDGTVLDYERAVSLLGYTSAHLLDDAVAAIAARDGAALFGVVDSVVKSGHDSRRFVEDLLQRLRDLVIIALAGDEAKDVFVSVPEDQYARMVAQAEQLGAQRASLAADLTNDALTEMVGATAPRLQLELLCARLVVTRPVVAQTEVSDEPAEPTPEVASQLARLQGEDPEQAARAQAKRAGSMPQGKGVRGEPRRSSEPRTRSESNTDPRNRPMPAMPGATVSQVPPVPASQVQPAPAAQQPPVETVQAAPQTSVSEPEHKRPAPPAREPAQDQPATAQQADPQQPQTGETDLATIANNWQAIVADPNLSKIARAQLDAATGPVALDGGVLVVGFEQPGVANAFTARGAREVQQVLNAQFGLNLQVEGRAGGEPPAPKASAAQAAAPAQPAAPPVAPPTPPAAPAPPAPSAPSPAPAAPSPEPSAPAEQLSEPDLESSGVFEDFPMPPPHEDPFAPEDPYSSTVTGTWAPPPAELDGEPGNGVVDPDDLPDEPEPDPEEEIWEGASADDPEISQSNLVGLQVVLNQFDAKVIEEITH
ncbi:DNA polymerase III subunit gamma and tau [Trueperella bialowiezensis]|uniref:DNA polymerase III subunit gamma and tau n=1 Tax=Trueperella bialowiezensis TaxID=312285 RepID=UPI000F845BC2|nr:DNA polymerase III subunit gamma and tau [Trueperella bialowiezensis]